MTDSSAHETTIWIGKRMPDETVYVGISPDTGNPMYALPETDWHNRFRNPVIQGTWQEALKCIEKLNEDNACSHNDWRIPTRQERTAIFGETPEIPGIDDFHASLRGFFNLQAIDDDTSYKLNSYKNKCWYTSDSEGCLIIVDQPSIKLRPSSEGYYQAYEGLVYAIR